MTEKARYRLHGRTARMMATQHVQHAPEGHVVEIKAPTRSLEQNALLHGMAADLSKQVPWCGQTLSVEQWKRFGTAKLKKDKIVFDCNDKGEPDANAGLIVLGASTKEMGVRDVSALIEWFLWMGAQHGVEWTHETKKLVSIAEHRRK